MQCWGPICAFKLHTAWVRTFKLHSAGVGTHHQTTHCWGGSHLWTTHWQQYGICLSRLSSQYCLNFQVFIPWLCWNQKVKLMLCQSDKVTFLRIHSNSQGQNKYYARAQSVNLGSAVLSWVYTKTALASVPIQDEPAMFHESRAYLPSSLRIETQQSQLLITAGHCSLAFSPISLFFLGFCSILLVENSVWNPKSCSKLSLINRYRPTLVRSIRAFKLPTAGARPHVQIMHC